MQIIRNIEAGMGDLKAAVSTLSERMMTVEKKDIELSTITALKLDSLGQKMDEFTQSLASQKNDHTADMRNANQRIKAVEDVADAAETKIEHQRDMDALDKKIDGVNESVSGLDKRVSPFVSAIRWIAITIGAMVIALLWAVFTHQVTLVFN